MSQNTVELTSQRYINKNGILKDLISELRKEQPTQESSQLITTLAIEQNCNLERDFLAALSQSGEESLSNFIKMYVRDNTNDATELPATTRYLFTKSDQEPNEIFYLEGSTNSSTLAPIIHHNVNPFDFFGSKPPSWSVENGWIHFKDRIEALINFQLTLKLDFGGATVENPTWRLSNTGTNRMVSVYPVIELQGSFNDGRNTSLQMPGALFYPEDLTSGRNIKIVGSFIIKTKDNTFSPGIIDKMRLSLNRGPWVANTRGTSNAKDRVSLVKKTEEGVIDTQNNYLEIIEL